jgi:hypothetical protein
MKDAPNTKVLMTILNWLRPIPVAPDTPVGGGGGGGASRTRSGRRTPRAFRAAGKRSERSEEKVEIILPCDTLENINDALFTKGTKLKVGAITADMKSQVNVGDLDKMCRLIVPPSESDDTLHVARIMRYMLNREFKTAKQLKLELRANVNISGASIRPRSGRTPRTPRTANASSNYRSVSDNVTELSLLLQRYPVNVAVLQEVNGQYQGKIVHEKGSVKDWTLIIVTKQRHLEILANENVDRTYGVVFTTKDEAFQSIFDKLQVNAERFTMK